MLRATVRWPACLGVSVATSSPVTALVVRSGVYGPHCTQHESIEPIPVDPESPAAPFSFMILQFIDFAFRSFSMERTFTVRSCFGCLGP
jgi:hypothetical protein